MTHTVALVGTSGAGKSTVGPLLAAQLGVTFLDVDAEIERQQGRPIRDIFATDGEPFFRLLECEATVAALADTGVVALGGGAPMTPGVEQALTGHHVIWLRVSPESAAARVGCDPRRPLLAADALTNLRRMLHDRAEVYERVSSTAIDTEFLQPTDVVKAILRAVRETEIA